MMSMGAGDAFCKYCEYDLAPKQVRVCMDREGQLCKSKKREGRYGSFVPGWHTYLWDAINAYAVSMGGRPSKNNTMRKKAMAAIENAVRKAQEDGLDSL